MLEKIGSDTFCAAVVDIASTSFELTFADRAVQPPRRPRAWERVIWRDQLTGRYFYLLTDRGMRLCTGFHGLHESAPAGPVTLPCLRIRLGSAESDDQVEQLFLAQCNLLCQQFVKRDRLLRPIRNEAAAMARSAVQEYLLHHGQIVQASRCSVHDGYVHAFCRQFGDDAASAWNMLELADMKRHGFWPLSAEDEGRLR